MWSEKKVSVEAKGLRILSALLALVVLICIVCITLSFPASSSVSSASCAADVIHSKNIEPGLNKLVLVTGGCGFIGSNLVEILVRTGYRVRVLDNLSTGNLSYLVENVEFMFGDITNKDDVNKAMTKVSFVFHLAAMSKVAPSMGDPTMADFCHKINSQGTLNVLEAALKHKIKKVVYAASSTFYGNNPIPNRESDQPAMQTPYASSKYQGETLMQMYDDVYGLPTLRLRFFMVYGPRQPSSGPYAIVTGKFLKMKQQSIPLRIEGDGLQTRDFIHVHDICRALILGMQSNIHGTVINVGTGIRTSINQVADIVWPGGPRIHVPGRTFDLRDTEADTCKAKSLLGFQAVEDLKTFMSQSKGNEKSYRSHLAVEMIVARGRLEDVTWTEKLLNVKASIYDKANWGAENFYPFNSGGETTPFLFHIIKYYDRLPEILFFSQAHPWNHIGSSGLDFISCMLSVQKKRKLSYLSLSKIWVQESRFDNHPQLIGVWELMSKELKLDFSVAKSFYANGIFLTTAKAIQSRPLSFWKQMYSMLTDIHKFPSVVAEGDHVIERIWWYLLQSPTSQMGPHENQICK